MLLGYMWSRRRQVLGLLVLCVGLYVSSFLYVQTIHQDHKQHVPTRSVPDSVQCPTPEQVQEQRKKKVKDYCRKYNLGGESTGDTFFLADPAHRLLFCINPKAACTTTLGLLAEMAASNGSKLHRENPLKVHNPGYMRKLGFKYFNRTDVQTDAFRQIQANYTKFLVVRHPFPRLVSAYWDKMSVHHVDHEYEEARKSVMRSIYGNKTADKNHSPAQAQTLNKTAKGRSVDAWRLNKNITKTRPLFQDFVTMMLTKSWKYAGDRHWASYYNLCSPCDIHYDYILKIESYAQEIEPILDILSTNSTSKARLREMLKPKNKSDALRTNSTISTKPHDKSIVGEYFNLTMDQRSEIYKRYLDDLELYGYDFDLQTAKAYYESDCGSTQN